MAVPHVFVDPSGRRRRLLRLLGVLGGVGLLCLLILLGVSLVTDPAPEDPQWSRRTDLGSNGESNGRSSPGSGDRKEPGTEHGKKVGERQKQERTGGVRPLAPSEPPAPQHVSRISPAGFSAPSSSSMSTTEAEAENRLMPPGDSRRPGEPAGADDSR